MGNRVGILTFHFSNHNYGAVLQSFASFYVLRKINFDPYIVNLLPNHNRSFRKFVKSILDGSINFELFRRKNLKLTEKVYDFEDLHFLNTDFDIFYVGSDQVWRASMAKNLLNHYFLDFVDVNKLKIAYAVSFGSHEWEANKETTIDINRFIKRFDTIFVREKQGVEICKEIFGINVESVLDPTLLLEPDEYINYFKLKIKKKDKKTIIGVYLLSEKEFNGNISKKIKSLTSFDCINIYGTRVRLFNRNFFHFNRVKTWLEKILNSDLIITDSFHCLVFSLIFKKNFVVINNTYRGNQRIKNLLENLNLSSRFCEKFEDFKLEDFLISINYNPVTDKLNQERNRSMNLLKKALGLGI